MNRLRIIVALLASLLTSTGAAENWPRWRGPRGNAVSGETPLPLVWDRETNVRWHVELPGEGSSSPIVWGNRLFVTSALDEGLVRAVHCLDARAGRRLWTRTIEDDFPEITSAVTGHAAPTPVTDGEHVVAFFGNAGVVCYDFEGRRLWHRDFGEFESELGIGSSPVIHEGRVILVCDHDGTAFHTFDSFLIALDVKTGNTVWKRDRPKLFRSWSTPIVVPGQGDKPELVVNAQDAVRTYDPRSGEPLWQAGGMTGWVTPSPVFGHGLIFAASGKSGPVLAIHPGGRGDVAHTHVSWRHESVGPYVCSPLLYRDELYVHREDGVLTVYDARSGGELFRERLGGKFTASGVAGDGKVYLTNEDGTTWVIAAGRTYRLLAKNRLDEYTVASPAVSGGWLYLRTAVHLWCMEE